MCTLLNMCEKCLVEASRRENRKGLIEKAISVTINEALIALDSNFKANNQRGDIG